MLPYILPRAVKGVHTVTNQHEGRPNQQHASDNGHPTPPRIPAHEELGKEKRANTRQHQKSTDSKRKVALCPALTRWVRETTFSDALMVLLTAVIAVVTGVYTHYAKRQWDEMRRATNASIIAANAAAKQADVSASQLELAERPWISIEVKPVGGVEQEPLGAHLTVAFTYRNIGTTPATGIVLVPELYAEGITDDAVSERKSVCQFATTVPADFGETLFPNTSRTEVRSIRVSREKINNALTSSLSTDRFFAALVVCVAYRPSFQESARYYTGIIYGFDHAFPANRDLPAGAFQMQVKGVNGTLAK